MVKPLEKESEPLVLVAGSSTFRQCASSHDFFKNSAMDSTPCKMLLPRGFQIISLGDSTEFFQRVFHEDPNFVSFQKIREDSSQQNCEYYKCATAVNPLSSQQGRRRRKEKE